MDRRTFLATAIGLGAGAVGTGLVGRVAAEPPATLADDCTPPPTLWSTLATGPTADVTLPDGATVLLDVDVADARTLVVPAGATLAFDTYRSTMLRYGRRIDVAGTISARPALGVIHELASVAIDEAEYRGGNDGMPTDPGIHVHSSGLLDLHGGPTRGVRITSPTGGRSHVLWHPTAGTPCLSDVDLIGLGPSEVAGRYPVHLHLMADASRGGRFDRLAVFDSANRAFVPHGSHGTSWFGCTADEVRGDALWWDRSTRGDGGIHESHDTLIEDMTISNVRPFPSGAGRFTLAAFSLNRGRRNTIRRSTARFVHGTKNASGFKWPSGEHHGSAEFGWTFEDNLAEDCDAHGIYFWTNTNDGHVVRNFTARRCARWGVVHGAYRNGARYERLLVEDCGVGGLLINAMSKPDAPLSFDDVRVVRTPIGISTGKHVQPSDTPTTITAPSFVDVDRPMVAAPRNHPDRVIVEGWPDAPEWDGAVPADSWWRVDGFEHRPVG